MRRVAAKLALLKRCGWRNVRLAHGAIKQGGAHQLLEELALFFRVVTENRPVSILEIGIAEGGTFQAWRQLAPRQSTVLGIDPSPSEFPNVIEGFSQDLETFNQVKKQLAKPIDLLFIDGDHRYESVLADVTMYSRLVRPGGIIALHDIQPTPSPGKAYSGEVYRLWEALKASLTTYEIVADPNQEGYGIGYFYKPEGEVFIE